MQTFLEKYNITQSHIKLLNDFHYNLFIEDIKMHTRANTAYFDDEVYGQNS